MTQGWTPEPGAYPCSGFLTVDELAAVLDELSITHSAVPVRPAFSAAA